MSQNDCVFCKILRRDGVGGGAQRGGGVGPKDASVSKAPVRVLVVSKERVCFLDGSRRLTYPVVKCFRKVVQEVVERWMSPSLVTLSTSTMASTLSRRFFICPAM